METTIDDIKKELAAGNRVLMLLRHAERPSIDNEDKSFGGNLPLTEEGARSSERLGEMLKGASEKVQFLASPLLRTVLTARHVASGMGIATAEIPTDPVIGNSSAYVESEAKIWDLFRDRQFFRHMFEYFERGEQYGFNPLRAATERFEADCLARFSPAARFGIFLTHDVYVASFCIGRGVFAALTEETWPRFLDAAAIIIEPSGALRRVFVRTGLSARYRGDKS